MIRYRLDDAQASRRALVSTLVGAVTTLGPVALAAALVGRLGWAPGGLFWALAAALVALTVTRAIVAYSGLRRRLRALVFTLDDGLLSADSPQASESLPRDRVRRIVEVDGALGGLRVRSDPAAREVVEIRIPRGGEGYAEVRAQLETWHAVERRGRRGLAVRLAMGVLVVAAIFFLPFLLDDFVSNSRWIAAALVGAAWLAVRSAMRGG